MVYLGRGLARDLIATIPSDLKYHARDPKRNVALGGRNAIFVPMTGAPYVRDLDNVSRNPLLDDLAMFHKLNRMLPSLHSSAHHMAEPNDHPKCALILDWAPHAISAAVIHVNVPRAVPNLF